MCGHNFYRTAGKHCFSQESYYRMSNTHLQDIRWSLLNEISLKKIICTPKPKIFFLYLCWQLDACVVSLFSMPFSILA